VTMACIAEALGLALPGAATVEALSEEQGALIEAAARLVVELADGGPGARAFLGASSFENAIRLGLAFGGSTNMVLHLLALAAEVDVPLKLANFDHLSRETPLLARLKPASDHTVTDFHAAGGVRALMAELAVAGLMHTGALEISEGTLADRLDGRPGADGEIIRPIAAPLAPEGGLAVLYGNLAPRGAVVKQAAVVPEMLQHSGPARRRQLGRPVRVRQQPDDGRGYLGRIFGIDQQAGLAINHGIGYPAGVAGNHRQTAEVGFQIDQAQALNWLPIEIAAGHNKEISNLVEGSQFAVIYLS